jgi:Pro-kumamolisin, activation domain/Bacterial surface protein, Ig-like domain/Immunoglobulin domain/Immunoglobulin I-set domain/Bacterial Ig-like domain (group 3)/Bacterial Ig domain
MIPLPDFLAHLKIGTRSAEIEGVYSGGFPKLKRWQFWAGFSVALFVGWSASAQAAPRYFLRGHVPAAVAGLAPLGRLPATNQLNLSMGLPLRNQAELDKLLRQLYDPTSPNFHKFITPAQFAARFGPTEQEYQAVIKFARTNGLAIAGTHPNRVVLDVAGSVSNIEQAFQITLRTYRHPAEARNFFAPATAPSVPANLSVVTVEGLNDYELPKPLLHRTGPLKALPLGGSGPSGYYAGNDFRNAYAPGTTLNGAGQSVGLLEFSSYYQADITRYESTIGLTNDVPLNNVVIGHPAPNTANNDEVALDIEVAIAMAPGLSQVIVYETRSSPSSILSRMANDDLAKQLSCSWTWGGGPSTTIDNIFKQMAAQGQSFFQASGDSDAYTGSQTLDNSSQATAPVDSTNLTCVGGTTLTMSGAGVSWSSETVWNWNNSGQPNVGSGGGISTYYTIPWWQTNVNIAANSGSTVWRNIPDVALTADNVFVDYNNGSSGGFGGTSCAAPLWAGFCALVNQQSVAANGTTVGFLNPALYALAAGNDYAKCFHDITAGNNIGTGPPGLFYAVPGYDLCTGLGTPNGTNLINALAPLAAPYFIAQPSSQTATNGDHISFSVSAGGQLPLAYQWLFNGTNLPDGGNVSGATSNTLTLAPVTLADAGSYRVVVTNNYGSVTSGMASLTVVFPPSFTTQPTNLTLAAGSNAVFSATLNGASPLAFHWWQNGTSLVNGGNISGATSNVLTLAPVTLANAGNYSLVATNIYGSATSSIATLTVTQPPAITIPPASQTIQCGSNATFSVTATGALPLNYQWFLDGTAVADATNASLSLTNIHLPDHMVVIVVTNLYGSASNTALLAVEDTLAPLLNLNGSNPIYVELGSAYVEPGATAYDLCAGVVPVNITGVVNTNAVSTNTVIYTADDGNGNTNTVTRTVLVRDTTPPTIWWSFTNLVAAADTNCDALMPDVTGTNFIHATDVSGPLTIAQSPTNGSALALGTNPVVIAVSDIYSNTAYSYDSIIVQDRTPPVFVGQPQSRTNLAGTTADFSAAAAACTPIAYQWFFNDAILAGSTNRTLTLTNITSASAGNYFAVAGADGGSTTSSVATLSVDSISPSLAAASSENPSGFRDSLNFTASLTPTNAAGTIQFLTNGAAFDVEPLVAGAAVSTNLSSLPRGTNLITAVYSGDADDLPATNTLAQIITNHPPVVADVFCERLAGYPLDIAVTDLATNWSDADGDAISLASIGISTNGVTVTNDAGTLVYFDTNDVDDEFACAVSDGWGGTNFQTVRIAIVLTNAVPTIIGIGNGSNGSVTLNLAGAPGYTYILEATTNLLPPVGWQPLATNTLGTNGLWQFTDAEAADFATRFFRLKLGP